MTKKLKCPKCNSQILVNPDKHKFDDYIICNYCKTQVPNPFKEEEVNPTKQGLKQGIIDVSKEV